MKPTFITSMYRTLLIGSLLSVSTGLVGCQKTVDPSISNQNIPSSSSPLNLGTLQGELRLPPNQECFSFTAYQVGQEEPLFEIDVEQARVRDHRYSFLQTLPEGDYQVKGTLSCVSPDEGPVEHDSLYDDVSITAEEVSPVQFRFFFDVESDLSQVDLKFCADLALRSLSPAFEACPGEQIQSKYDVSWLREDCGEVFLQLGVNGELFEGENFAFPAENAFVEGYAPEELGSHDLLIALLYSITNIEDYRS